MKCLVLVAVLAIAGGARAQDIPTFYRCGNVLSERPMPACADAVIREQRLEAARVKEQAEKERVARQELAGWLAKYPNPAAVERERQEGLRQVRLSTALNDARIAALEEERRRLVRVAYDAGEGMPQGLRNALNENEADLSLRKHLALAGEEDLKRVDRRYDWTLKRMRELWKKAPIESLRAGSP